MTTMCKENDIVTKVEKGLGEAKRPFSGKGFTLGSPVSQSTPQKSNTSRPIAQAPLPFELNPVFPTTSIQVGKRLENLEKISTDL